MKGTRLLRWVLWLLLIALVLLTLSTGADATHSEVFAVEGPGAEIVQQVYEDSSWDWTFGSDVFPETQVILTPSHPPYWGDVSERALVMAGEREGEIAFPFEIAGTYAGVSYYPTGDIYIDSRLPEDRLREIAMHEAAHARVMFRFFHEKEPGQSIWDCRPLREWRELIEPGLSSAEWSVRRGNWRTSDLESHAEHFRCVYYPLDLQHNRTPRTALRILPAEQVIAFHNRWIAEIEKPEEPSNPEPQPLPWSDIDPGDAELLAAANWAKETGLFLGYPDGTFGVHKPVLKRHVALIVERCGMSAPPWHNDYDPATRRQVRDAMLGLVWHEARWDESLTRSQLLRLMWRHHNGESQDAEIAAKLEAWFNETYVTWRGVTRQPRLIGQAALMVQLSREHRVPLWLALGQCWRESQWYTTGLSTRYNCGWGMKDAIGKWGALGDPPVVSKFANYVSVAEAVRAYFRLMDSPVYRDLLDAQDWRGVLDRYAPYFENCCEEHWRIVQTVRSWCEERGIW